MALPAPRTGATSLVTGASSGLGRAFAEQLAERGHALTLVARRGDRLEQLAGELRERHGVAVDVHAGDLCDPAVRDGLAAGIHDTGRAVDLLVNNAGFGMVGPYVRADATEERRMAELNVVAVLHLCRAFVPAMAERGSGAVLNVGSLAGFQPLPGMAAYAGTKAFTLNFTASLHAEVRRRGVAVTALMPGGIRTEFAHAAGGDDVAAKLPDAIWMEPDDMARGALRDLGRGRWLSVPGRANGLVGVLGRHVPRRPLLAVASLAVR